MAFRTLLALGMAFVGWTLCVVGHQSTAAKPADPGSIALSEESKQFLQRYCYECHSTSVGEADIDLEAWGDLGESTQAKRLEQIVRVLQLEEMPPSDSRQPNADEKKRIVDWAQARLRDVSIRTAGDPGPVVLRRLNNTEYTNTVRDLTGIDSLDPAKEFPGDNAAGEGFTNAGAAMVMSPSLLTKYLEAAKSIAQHTVMLPDGISFSASTSPNDWANERLDKIRTFYSRFTDSRGADKVNLQGIVFETNQGGRLPFESYLAALHQSRNALAKSETTIEQIAAREHLSPKYLGLLWEWLSADQATKIANQPSLLDTIKRDWQKAADGHQLASQQIAQWQRVLWRFNSVGHIGKLNGPRSWQEAVDPVAVAQTLRWKVAEGVTDCYLTIDDAADGSVSDNVILQNPRFVVPGQQDIPLSQAIAISKEWEPFQKRFIDNAPSVLKWIDTLSGPLNSDEIRRIATELSFDPIVTEAWVSNVGMRSIASGSINHLESLLTQRGENLSGYASVSGWLAEDALSILANSSEETLRVPGTMLPKSLAVHPAPTQSIGIGLRLPPTEMPPADGRSKVGKVYGLVQHAHPECGNGTQWSMELWRGETRLLLASGITAGSKVIEIPTKEIPLRGGDELCLIVSPRDGNHACDLTRIDFTVEWDGKRWNATESNSQSLLKSNPNVDSQKGSWRFFRQPVSAQLHGVVPQDSELAQWVLATSSETRQEIAERLVKLLRTEDLASTSESNRQLRSSLTSIQRMLSALPSHSSGDKLTLDSQLSQTSQVNLDQNRISVHGSGWVRIPIPRGLQAGWEFVVDAALDSERGKEGSVQLSILGQKPETRERASIGLRSDLPILLHPEGGRRQEFAKAFDQFRELFPIALCYPKIVPVDEVVTLTLYHREDSPLIRLMLDENQRAELERMWDELHFVSQDALRSVDVYEQLWQYATQDADPSAFEPLRQPILERANSFRRILIEAEPQHVRGMLTFAERAYRRPLKDHEIAGLEKLYESIRHQGLTHQQAIHGCIARILVSPAFLYRVEKSLRPRNTKGDSGPSAPLDGMELATRMSYFLWSSMPDEELVRAARDGSLLRKEGREEQWKRMLRDPKSKRFAREFFGQWLRVAHVDQWDEKSETVFPQFVELRSSLQSESNRFFEHLVEADRSPLELLSADYTFVDSKLAAMYGIPNVDPSAGTVRVSEAGRWNRGGILTHASVLATQSGASRTSAILRGTWISEVLLGEHLPKPPKNVPPLPESVPDNLSERQLIELHASDPACSKCHRRIDPFGFALENYDAIGRFRTEDTSGHRIDANAKLPDGTLVSSASQLRDYLVQSKKEAFLMQFHRKLLGYAIGRECLLSDRPLLEELSHRAVEDPEYSMWDAIQAVIESRPFREIRGDE